MSFDREPLRIVRIRAPICSRTFGVSPCLATGTACYQTDATCKFRTALDLTAEQVFDFVEDGANEWQTAAGAYQPALAVPSLRGVDTSPTELNVATGANDKGPLGLRAVADVTFADHPSNDIGIDPYVATRAYDPMAQGSFWSKWLARHPFHAGYDLEVYEGQMGDALAAMEKRVFEIDKVTRARGQVRVTAKDLLRRIAGSGVKAPALSPGALASDIDAGQASIAIAGAAAGDYPAPGWVRIGSEILSYAGLSVSAGTVTLPGCARGVLNSEAATHKQGDLVQWVLAYQAQRFDAILYDLVVTRGGIAAAAVMTADWTAEADTWRPEYIFTAYITEPTDVDQLVSEVCLQALVNLWVDERTGKVILRAQRPDTAPPALTDAGHIKTGTLAITEKPEQRVSRVQVFYSPRSWLTFSQKVVDYERGAEWSDVTREVQYGGAAQIKQLFCRWVPTNAIASTIAATFLARFRDVRREIQFDLTDGDVVWTGDTFTLQHFDDTDASGASPARLWLVTSAEAAETGIRYAIRAEDSEMVGRIWYLVDDTIPDWASASPTQKATIGYLTDDDGNTPDGNPSPFKLL